MQNLDVLNMSLYGIRLIEASAGTGKTYNLIIIYLRLLLNLTDQLKSINPLTVKNILVVTFTNAAAKELRLRIADNIQQLRLDCIKGYSNNYLFSKLLLQIDDFNIAINLLSIAEKELDQAPIFTIHSFCQKILIENRIELNTLFHTSIVENESTIYQQICFDFWRRHFYSLPLNIITFIQQYWKNPEELLNDILPYIHQDIPKFQYHHFIIESNNQIPTFYSNIISCIDNLKKTWLNYQCNIIDTIHIFNINRKIYNKKNLIRWIESINQWSQKPTLDHILPNYLERFRSSVLQINNDSKKNSISSLYLAIEELYQRLLTFPALICHIAIYTIRQNLNHTKYLRSTITFNDLIDLLSNHISDKQNDKLSHIILSDYPVAIIDEFQDTDYNQYKIFQKLYSNQSKKHSLILIGDPKQAIYGFRGADIFSYMKIRNSLPYKYNLNINWRTSPHMVNAINQLFQISNPFIFPEIPFIPAISAYQNRNYKLMIHNQPQTAICFWLHPDKMITMHNYKTAMLTECINTIQYLLYNIHHKTAWLENKKYKKKILKKSDIVILVRNHEEASMVRLELLKTNISSIFLSNRKNIFDTMESYELLLLLQAILFPNQKTICTALTTIFFGLKVTDIEQIYHASEPQWRKILAEFSEYYLIWTKHGIFAMIQKIMFHYKIPETLLSINSGKSSLINILHLGELLNNANMLCQTKYELLQWLKLKINQSSNQNKLSSKYILKYDDDHDLIKISTIHQSKGLEFPITLLPFIASFQKNKKILFHDRKSFELYLDFDHNTPINSKLSDEERLADDLRLLYVAITRSIYHCSIGIAPIIQKYRRHSSHAITDLHLSAIGYLIQNKQPSTAESLKKYLHNLNVRSNGDIEFRTLSNKQTSWIFNQTIPHSSLSAATWNPIITQNYNNPWNITSYSALKNTYTNTTHIDTQYLLKFSLNNHLKNKQSILTIHDFPKGKIYGNFFHNLFKTLDFKKSINIQWLQTQMILYNINLNWIEIIQRCIYTVINTPLNQYNLTLSKIISKNKKTELKFCININTNLTASELNTVCKYYDALSHRITTVMDFKAITGLLKGFIDLVFFWNKKYYLLDYKTNWLGHNSSSYIQSNMELEIMKYHYDLQYQIYTIALHRFLKKTCVTYNYEKHFGGIYYLFIRGMDGLSSNNGIYFCRPTWIFIKKLDQLF